MLVCYSSGLNKALVNCGNITMGFVVIMSFGIVMLAALTNPAKSLQCYQCVDVAGSSDLISSTGHSDPSCRNAPTSSAECQSGQVCGYSMGSIQGHLIEMTAEVNAVIRGCMPLLDSDTTMGCHKNEEASGVISKVLSSLSDLGDVHVDGEVCYCDTDFCQPECDGLYVGEMCVQKWVFIVAGIGLLLVIILVCTCCCCCGCCGCCQCCSCCKRRNDGYMVQPLIITGPTERVEDSNEVI
ncbi:unnamed protein product [Owenia fusiformis]|uniref:Uncharacterized protein n=1 Tax=Owenia fusiformis TaxID=6347 RepID=A0A8J1TWU1_OWEFU|nr:unnamed protein product [Owenia fusiformis]